MWEKTQGIVVAKIYTGEGTDARRFNATQLHHADFDFTDSETGYLTHGLHPYPAKFIPQIPDVLIRELSSEGDTVADVFCGSGTTLVEALILNRNAIGFDANPLACLITKAKTTRFAPGDKANLRSLVAKSEDQAYEVANAGKTLFHPSEVFISAAPRPSGETLGFWFEPFVVEELAEILSWCKALPTESARTVGLVAFSSIVVVSSKQDSDTRYVRREKNVVPGETMTRFARALKSALIAVDEFSGRIRPDLSCQVVHANILEQPPSRSFDLMVCSPPYPNAFSYHLYHMTRMVWLGMDQPKFKRQEIGSHRKYSAKGPNGATAQTFQNEMRTILNWLRDRLKPGGFACFVVGDSTIRRERVNNADLIAAAGHCEGFSEVARPTRRLQTTKKAFNPVIGKIKEEKILILQNRGAI
ncbi:MAG: DNA methyltransferase [Candidatus Binatus sp.]|nr:DNA methyltransferase [Candidatus Binatus sp.]MDO8430911.1 DNA methyltransferase [Candidatus Binatus sp.]